MTKQTIKNQNGIKGVTIIANELMYNLKPYSTTCGVRHCDKLRDFIYNTGVNVPVKDEEGKPINDSTVLAYHFAITGFCVLLYNSLNQAPVLEVYLPKELTENQKYQLQQAINNIGTPKLIVLHLKQIENQEEEKFHYSKEASQSVEGLQSFINKIPTYTKEKHNTLRRTPKKGQ